MKIAFISTIPTFPATGGNRAKQLGLSEELIRRGHEVHFIFLSNRQMGDFDEEAHRAFFGAGRFHILTRNKVENALYFAKRLALKLIADPASIKHKRVEDRRLLVDETYYNGFTRQIRALHKTVDFDCALVTYVTSSRAFEAFPKSVFKIIDTHDLLSGFIPPAQETKGLRRADAVLAIQETEAEVFRKMLKDRASTVSILSQFSTQPPPIPVEHSLGATFLGSSFRANRQSINYFVQSVLPLIMQKCPEFKFYVAGSIGNDIPDAPNIVKLGFVPSPRDAFEKAPISLNPIISGTGVKIKFIDSLSNGLPVVTTRFGVQGVPDKYLTGVKVVDDDDAQGFADAVVALYQDQALRRKLADAAYAAGTEWNREQLSLLDGLLDRVAAHRQAYQS
jgi:glycosyltransferase involved in cell wall biosynthesis